MQKKTLAEQTADDIAGMIMTGRFEKGERLPSEFELAALLDVGRGTIREAVKILASKHVVEIRRGRGTFITEKPGRVDDPLGLAFIANRKKLAYDLLELRLIIEPEIAALAAERATKPDVKGIETACRAVEQRILAGLEYAREDILLHERIAKAAKNQVVETIIPIIHSAVEMFVELSDEDLTRSTLVSHRAIIEAIGKRQPSHAAAAMKRHLERNRDAIDRFAGGRPTA